MLRLIVGVLAKFMLTLHSDDKPAKVISGNAGYVLAFRTKKVGKIANT